MNVNPNQTTLLRALKVSKRFGGLTAVKNVDFYICNGEIVGLIGPNGAGKTTLFNCITGMHQATEGQIVFKPHGNDIYIHNLVPHQITRLGIARTFQNIRLFSNMTALENVMVGQHTRTKTGAVSAIIKRKWVYMEEKAIESNAFRYLNFVGLDKYANHLATNLPYGLQRRLEIARAIASEPRLLLLDEPAAGMNPSETDDLMELINKIKDNGITILLIEHHMNVVMGISDRIAVLDQGIKIAEGTPDEIKRDEKVIAAYLGREE